MIPRAFEAWCVREQYLKTPGPLEAWRIVPRACDDGLRARCLKSPIIWVGLENDFSSLLGLVLVWGREGRGLEVQHLEPPRAWGRSDVLCISDGKGKILEKWRLEPPRACGAPGMAHRVSRGAGVSLWNSRQSSWG